MTMLINHNDGKFETKLPTRDDFHIARSVFLDAFAELEIAVCELLATSPTYKSHEKKSFGHRIEDLKNLKPSPKIPEKKCASIPKKIARIQPLLAIRSDIVHSRTDITNVDGVMHAKICNNLMSLDKQPYVRLFNLQHFRAFTGEVKKIANELRQILNPPSSPPQPKPA